MTARIAMLERRYAQTRSPLLMTALVAGDPHVEATLKYMGALAEEGVDVIELIVPFSDPTYHGAVIQRACARALHEDVSWEDICALVGRFREHHDTPVVVSSYYNRLHARGLEVCADELATGGVDAIMVFDLPWDESARLEEVFAARQLVTIRTIAPTTSEERFAAIAEGARGFFVWTGHSGGEVTISEDAFRATMGALKRHTSLPIVASMQISSGEEAVAVARHAGGALVGSALVWLIESRGPELTDRVRRFARQIRAHL